MRLSRAILSVFVWLVLVSGETKSFDEGSSGDTELSGDKPPNEEKNELNYEEEEEEKARNQISKPTSKTKHETSDDSTDSGISERARLVNKAVEELKAILKKRTVPPNVKTAVLSRIFDTQGDPKKADLAHEIFQKALAPAMPTNGAVGDLGAEMIKVSVLSKAKRKLLNRFKPTGNMHFHHKKRKEHNIFPSTSAQQLSASQRKANTAINYGQKNSADTKNKKIKTISKLERNSHRLKLINEKLRTMLQSRHKYHKYVLKPKFNTTSTNEQYHLVKVEHDPTINMKGKTAKLLSVRVHSRHGLNKKKQINSSTDKNSTLRERKDYVIELDDNDNEGGGPIEDDNGERRHLDSVVSLLKRLSLPSNGNVEVIDEDVDSDSDRNPDEFDDGYISPQRRRMGQNLFMNSMSDENEDDQETDEQAYQRSLDNYENEDSEYFDPRFRENSFENENENENDDDDRQGNGYFMQSNMFNNRPSINPYTRFGDQMENRPTFVMEYDRRKRDRT